MGGAQKDGDAKSRRPSWNFLLVESSGDLRNDVVALREQCPKDTSLTASKISARCSISSVWDGAMWEDHHSTWRYYRNLARIHKSTVFQSVWPFVAAMVVYSLLVQYFCTAQLSLGTRSSQASSIGLLLVFRTNQAAARALEGRRVLGTIKRQATSIAALLRTCGADAAVVDVASRYCALAVWAVKGAVRRGGDEASRFAYESLLPAREKRWVAAHQGFDDRVSPSTVALRLRYAVREATSCAVTRDRLEAAVEELQSAYGGCDRLYTTPIPPGYLRHISRSLVIWLALLPFSIASSHSPATLSVTVSVTSYLLLGIDNIATQIEEVFSVLPIHELALSTSAHVAAIADGPAPPALVEPAAPPVLRVAGDAERARLKALRREASARAAAEAPARSAPPGLPKAFPSPGRGVAERVAEQVLEPESD